jgi:cellulose synthase/poly-beta-1,6-N-acetylglucosamine synthase-like glycosyltransferase
LDNDALRQHPRVSIILPTYNRARFLPQAFASIRAQTFNDWELLVIDDGSTDDTQAVVEELSVSLSGSVRYVHQANQGAHAARNTGIELARGDYLAFFDSDDYWLPHHLHACVAALQANPEVDWVYGAARMVELATGRTLAPTTFYQDGQPRPFLRLRTQPRGRLRVIEDPKAAECMISHGLMCGLQCSVFRAGVFAGLRLPPYEVGEDQIFVVLALKAGCRLAYYDDVHLLYHVHGENLSAATLSGSVEKRVRGMLALTRGYEELPERVSLVPAERRALRRRLGGEYFWHLGYSLLWQHGRREEALTILRKGLRQWPWNLACWKTYLLALVRTRLRLGTPV